MLEITQFCTLRPTLYHLAAAESWPCLQRYGLLSSQEILGKFGTDQQHSLEIETHRLTGSYVLQSEEHGSFTLRDRTTLSHAALKDTLQESCSSDEWIDLLSQRVFLFAQRRSLESLLKAPLNRNLCHVVLEVDSRKLFDAYGSSIEVAEINTGFTKRRPAKRGPGTFQSPSVYTRTKNRQIVEVTVLKSVPNLMPLLQRAVLRRPCGSEELLYAA